jgi:hypothetical protein
MKIMGTFLPKLAGVSLPAPQATVQHVSETAEARVLRTLLEASRQAGSDVPAGVEGGGHVHDLLGMIGQASGGS